MGDHVFHLVDVFTDSPFTGNQLAVFPDGSGLSPAQMQSIAGELNFSETTFVLPPADPSCDVQVRIFTPTAELPMAGHPTIGTAFVLAREGRVRRLGATGHVRFEEGVGPIDVALEFAGDSPGMIWMSQPVPQFGAVFDAADIAPVLGLAAVDFDPASPMQIVSAGVPTLVIPLISRVSAARARVRMDALDHAQIEAPLLYCVTRETEREESTAHVRMFAPTLGIVEDPGTGGAAGPFAAYAHCFFPGAPTRQVIEQGIEIGRPSILHVELTVRSGAVTAVRVGGRCAFVARGSLEIE